MDKFIGLMGYFSNKNIFRYSPSIRNETLIKFRSHVFTKKKLKFLFYWGVGYKSKIDAIDISAIEFQLNWINEVTSLVNLDYEVQYIITDAHAFINNIPKTTIESYSNSLILHLDGSKIKVIKSTELLKKYGILDIFKIINEYNIDIMLDDSSYKSILRGLEKQSKSYENRGNYLDYFKCNIIENAIIEEEYSKYIFVTYGVPETKLLLPNLPKIYTYVNKKRQIQRPWFTEG